MDYHYSDFLFNPRFIRWKFNSTDELDAYWMQFLESNP